jgi:RNA polymerase I-specific transcription initiation factor RRN7
VVRDLWDLRIRAFGSILPSEHPAEGELEIFSSQPTPSDSEGEMSVAFGRRSWDPDRGSDWPMPRMIDTIALCYLGCLLLRIPLRIGQIFTWADKGQIPYKNAVN